FETLGIAQHWDTLVLDPLAAREVLTLIFRSKPRTDWLQLLQDNGVPCAPVGAREDWFAGDAVAQGELRQVFEHPTLGEIAVPAPPARLSDTPASIRGLARPIDEPPTWTPRAVAGSDRGEGGQP